MSQEQELESDMSEEIERKSNDNELEKELENFMSREMSKIEQLDRDEETKE